MKIETALDLITEKIDEFGKRVVKAPFGSSPTNIAAGSAAKQHGFASDVTGEKSLDKTQRMVRGIDFKDYVVNSKTSNPTRMITNYIEVFSKRKKEEGITGDKLAISILASVNKKTLADNKINIFTFLKALKNKFDLSSLKGNIRFKSFFNSLSPAQQNILNEEVIDEDALTTNTMWNKKIDTKKRIEKGKTENIGKRQTSASTPKGIAKNYDDTMLKGKKDSQGKHKEYTGGKILMGLPMTDKGRIKDAESHIEKSGTNRFEIIKKLFNDGKLNKQQVKRSKQLTDEQKEEILGD